MKVLVLRPQPSAGRTARALANLGHEAVIAPLIEIVPSALSPQARIEADAPYGAVIAASANAFALLPQGARDCLSGLPAYLVGERTAEAAREAGLRPVAPVFGTARELAAALPGSAPGKRLLYLAGHDRRPEIETALRDAGRDVTLVETYEARIVEALPVQAEAALRRSDLGAVLHFSRRTAKAYLRLASEAGLLREALSPLQICLSATVAEPLRAAGAAKLALAPGP